MSRKPEASVPEPIKAHFVLIRGLAREARHWGEFPLDLERAASETIGGRVRVDAIDIPGAGRFSEMRCPPSMPEIAEFVRGKFQDIRQKQREVGEQPAKHTILVAVSLGGMLATQWLERWPDDFNGTVLISTSFKGFSPIHHRLNPPVLKTFLDIARGKDAVAKEKQVLRLVSNRPSRYDETAKEWATIQNSRPVSLENFARQLLAAALFEPRLRRPPCPVLVLVSKGDRMVSPKCSLSIAERWKTDLREHPDAGHDLPLDESGWVIEQILEWHRYHFPNLK